jgi:hypothetical protein
MHIYIVINSSTGEVLAAHESENDAKIHSQIVSPIHTHIKPIFLQKGFYGDPSYF